MLRIFIISTTLAFFSCNSNQAEKKEKNSTGSTLSSTFPIKPLIIESEDEGWGADLKLSFTESTIKNNTVTYIVNSTYNNKNLGFEITKLVSGSGRLTIKSTGVNSDNFIHALQKLYKQKIDTTLKFINVVNADCMSMGEYVDSLNKQSNGNYISTAENKVFFQGKNEDDYAELYLNINEAEHWIEWKEKDEEYRPILIKLFSRK